MQKIQKITPFLWFEDKAEEATKFYVDVFSAKFEDSKIENITHYNESVAKASGRPAGSVMTTEFQLAGQQFVAINGGPFFKFSGAISFVVNCENQDEIDYFWEKLSEGGEKDQCGWIRRDKFGVTWQITPRVMTQYINDPDKKRSQRVMEAMLKMNKIIIADLKKAYEEKL